MLNEPIKFTELKNLNCISTELEDKIKTFSYMKGITLEILYSKRTNNIISIMVNNKLVDVSRNNISLLNELIALETNDISLEQTVTIEDFRGLHFFFRKRQDKMLAVSYDNGIHLEIVYQKDNGIVESIAINSIKYEVTPDIIDLVKEMCGPVLKL